MVTIISTRLGTTDAPKGGQDAYASDLIQYMDSPQRDNPLAGGKIEKCIARTGGNLPAEDMTSEQIAACMCASLASSKRIGKGQGIEHWVQSYKPAPGEEPPTPEQIFKGVRLWMKFMGYKHHMWHAVIHDDTEHRHVHIAICRMDELTGKIRPRGFWRRDNQKAMVAVARQMGWDVESATKQKFKVSERPEIVVTNDPVTGVAEIERRPVIEERDKESQQDRITNPIPESAEASIKSKKRILRERLIRVFAGIREQIPSMKWGQIHNKLAESGLQMERREHADKSGKVQYGLVFSADGKYWASASTLGIKELTWNALSAKVGKEWRKANKKARETVEESREKKLDSETPKGIKEQVGVVIECVASQEEWIVRLERQIHVLQDRKKAGEMERSLRMMQNLKREIEAAFSLGSDSPIVEDDWLGLGHLIDACFKFTEAGFAIALLARGEIIVDQLDSEINGKTFDIWIAEKVEKLQVAVVKLKELKEKSQAEDQAKNEKTGSILMQRDRPAVPAQNYLTYETHLAGLSQEESPMSITEFAKSLKISKVPDYIRESGLSIQSAMLADYGLGAKEGIAKSEIDFATAKGLYRNGATPFEVASFLVEHGLLSGQQKYRIAGTKSPLPLAARNAINKAARLMAAKAAPPGHYPNMARKTNEKKAVDVSFPLPMAMQERLLLEERQKLLENLQGERRKVTLKENGAERNDPVANPVTHRM